MIHYSYVLLILQLASHCDIALNKEMLLLQHQLGGCQLATLMLA